MSRALGMAPGLRWRHVMCWEGCGGVTGVEMGRDRSPKFSMFQSSCAAFCFLGIYFLLGLALIWRKCWRVSVVATLPDIAGDVVFGMRIVTALDGFAFLVVCTFPEGL